MSDYRERIRAAWHARGETGEPPRWFTEFGPDFGRGPVVVWTGAAAEEIINGRCGSFDRAMMRWFNDWPSDAEVLSALLDALFAWDCLEDEQPL
jgi:hypothetical protein